jgi:hypothetical protein
MERKLQVPDSQPQTWLGSGVVGLTPFFRVPRTG